MPFPSPHLPPAYEGPDPYIFISYAHADRELVLPLVTSLIGLGYRVWYDTTGMEGGDPVASTLQDQIQGCHCVVAFVTSSFCDSTNCGREVSLAQHYGKPILVGIMEDTPLTNGMDWRLIDSHKTFYTQYPNRDLFLRELCRSRRLAPTLAAGFTGLHDRVDPQVTQGEDADAIYRQGKLCLSAHNYAEAARWFRRAAHLDHPAAQLRLYILCREGLGVPQDRAEAMRWLCASAELGFARAQHQLGLCALRGVGIAQDPRRAFRLFLASANQGFVQSQYQLGVCYAGGIGVPADPDKGRKWLIIASERGSREAAEALQEMDARQTRERFRRGGEALFRRGSEALHRQGQNLQSWFQTIRSSVPPRDSDRPTPSEDYEDYEDYDEDLSEESLLPPMLSSPDSASM